jgi:hypothetical protein
VLDILAKGIKSPEQENEIIREIYEALLTGVVENPSRRNINSMEGLLEAVRLRTGLWVRYDVDGNIIFSVCRKDSDDQLGKLSSIIEYRRPVLTVEQSREVDIQVATLKQDIRTQFTRSVGKRGYELLVVDPALRDLGYESITFTQAPDSSIRVGMALGGNDYEFSLDSRYRIALGEDVKKFVSLQDQMWLELVTLSHLKKVMCTEEERISDELLGGERQYGLYKGQSVGRREHLRKLGPGCRYSHEAFLRCLGSHLPVKNLHRINKDRGATVEDGLWTYVSPVDVVDAQLVKPVKVAFATATDDIRAVIPLEQVSPEELARIERIK